MITSQSIKTHSKCLEILEMIKTCNNRISAAVCDLYHYNNAKPLDPIRIVHDRKEFEDILNKYKAIKNRLVLYYINTLLTLVQTPLTYLEQKQNKNEHITDTGATDTAKEPRKATV